MTEKRTILIVDDDTEINGLLAEILRESMYCLQAFDGKQMLKYWQEREQRPFDLILLDLMLPDTSGEELIRKVRLSSDIPIIVLTAKGDTHTLVDVLDLGADDYIAKPFVKDELMARIRSQMRRPSDSRDPVGEILEAGSMKIDTQSHELFVNNDKVYLPLKEFDLLYYLMLERGKVVTKEELYERVWGNVYLTDDNTINVHISRLRNKLREHMPEDPIETIWGVGFRFKAEI